MIAPNPSSLFCLLQLFCFINAQHVTALRIFLAGIHDLKTVSLNSTLAELGMYSMIAVELKETLERDFEVYLTSQEIHNLTFASINELSAANKRTDINRRHLEGRHTILFEGGELFVLQVKGKGKGLLCLAFYHIMEK
jgi:hypothetical protein